MHSLQRVRHATKMRALREGEWRDAIREAVASGESLRRTAKAAGITHVRVLHIARGAPPRKSVEYMRAHRAVVKARGAPNQCAHCGETDPEKVYDWANLTGAYDDVNDYERLCRSCHRRYDREHPRE